MLFRQPRFDPILFKIKTYVFKDVTATSSGAGNLKLNFFTVHQTIKEAKAIPFETLANRISGHQIIFLLSIIGYIILSFRHKSMLIGLPLIGLGFLAYSGGLRFTIYAVPPLALGIAYLVVEFSKFIKNKNFIPIPYQAYLVIFTIAILYPNITHAYKYTIPTMMNSTEVKTLDYVKSRADREDYMVAWWDYGYHIRYFSDVKTLIDGGNSRGHYNYPVSFILTNDQIRAAKMARLDVEYKEGYLKNRNYGSNLGNMMNDYGYKDSNKFLKSLSKDMKLPPKTRDIYFYLPYRMLGMYSVISKFSNVNLMNPKDKKTEPRLIYIKSFKETKGNILLGKNIKILKNSGQILIDKEILPINKMVQTSYLKGRLKTEVKTIDSKANVNVIFMKDYQTFLIVDNSVYNSLFFQLFVLENYNKDLYEPVSLNSMVKIYKLKI